MKQGKLFTNIWVVTFWFVRLLVEFSSCCFVSAIEVGFQLKEFKYQISNLLENSSEVKTGL